MHHRARIPASGVLLLAVAAALAVASGPAARADSTAMTVTRVEGSVEIGSGEPPIWRAARSGDALAPGETVRTGADGRAELTLGAATVRLFASSQVRVPVEAVGTEGAEAVELESGDSLFDVIRDRLRRGFEVRTPEVVVSVKGTQFGVARDGDWAAVSVFRGLVGVRDLAGRLDHEMLVREGFAAVGGLDRAFELVVLPDLDAWDAWSAGERLPLHPEQLVDRNAERAALEKARALGRATVRSELVEKVAAEHPERIRAQLRARAQEKVRAREADPVPPALDRPEPVEVLPAAPDASQDPTQTRLDPLADAQRIHRQRALAVRREVVSSVVEGAMSAGQAGVQVPFLIEVVNGAGPAKVVISNETGVLGQLTQSDLDQVLNGGDLSVLAPVLPILEQLRIDPHLFAEKLDNLI